ncbi:MAG: hypothetical protein ABI947_01710 [Chloroflexota bacterium]
MSSTIDSAQINALIAEKRYEEAKTILRQSSDPVAKSWLARLETAYPTPGAQRLGSREPYPAWNTGVNSNVYPTMRERGGCLTAWLLLASLANPAGVLYYLLNGNGLTRVLHLGSWVIPTFTLIGVLITICVVGIWQWKKWGVQGFLILGTITFFLNLFTLGLSAGTIGGLLGMGTVWYLVHNKWEQFE